MNSDKGVYFRTSCDVDGIDNCIDIGIMSEDVIEFSYWDQCARLDESAGTIYYQKAK